MGKRATNLECILKVSILSFLKKIGKMNSSEKKGGGPKSASLSHRSRGRQIPLAKMFN